jgi:hypothetical protein
MASLINYVLAEPYIDVGYDPRAKQAAGLGDIIADGKIEVSSPAGEELRREEPGAKGKGQREKQKSQAQRARAKEEAQLSF